MSDSRKCTSELRCFLTEELFVKVYTQFMEQADKNAISKKAHGTRVPLAISFADGDNMLDGGPFSQHFGQGSASRTPYISWWVVSVYYLVNEARIVIGIEESRYPHLNRMRPIRFGRIGNKKPSVAIFYEDSSKSINFTNLYNTFISICEEVMQIGLT